MSESKHTAREMTLSAIRKRFDWGGWDSADCQWLYAKAEQHAELLEALETALPYVEFYAEREMKSPSNNQEAVHETREMLHKFRAAIRKAKGE